jgi:type I restriction enzyme M protein
MSSCNSRAPCLRSSSAAVITRPAIEDANIDVLQDVLKGINFNRKIGQRTLDDDTLSNFIQNFEKIPLKDTDFEFPDLLGTAY